MANLGTADFAALFRTAPAKAVAAWRARAARLFPGAKVMALAAKGVASPASPWAYQDVLWNAHSRAFFVARVAKASVLSSIHDQVGKALEDGQAFQEFRNQLQPKLEAEGWWSAQGNREGKSLVRSPKTGEDEWTRLGTPRRLRTIYDTNLSVSYSSGHYAQLKANTDTFPWWEYVAVMDARTRPTHAALNGHVWRHDDPAWASVFPPNGWGCRCRAEPLTDSEARGNDGYIVQDPAPTHVRMMQVGSNGPTVPVMGVRSASGAIVYPDPGWAYNPGMAHQAVEDLAWNRISTLPAPAQKAFVDSIAKDTGLLTERGKMLASWTQAVQDTAERSGPPQRVAVGWLPMHLVDAAKAKLASGKALSQIVDAMGPVVTVTDGHAWHARRPSKAASVKATLEQFLTLPATIASPWKAGWDKGRLLLYSQPFQEGGSAGAQSVQRTVRFVLDRSTETGSMELITATAVNVSQTNQIQDLMGAGAP